MYTSNSVLAAGDENRPFDQPTFSRDGSDWCWVCANSDSLVLRVFLPCMKPVHCVRAQWISATYERAEPFQKLLFEYFQSEALWIYLAGSEKAVLGLNSSCLETDVLTFTDLIESWKPV